MAIRRISINLDKIDKSAIYQGKQGKYLNLTLFENRGGEDQYGNAGFVKQDLGMDRKDEDTPIIGNYKEYGTSPTQQRQQPAQRQPHPPTPNEVVTEEDIPW